MKGSKSAITLLFLPSLLLLLNGPVYSDHDLHPLILIPGQSANQIEARLTDAYDPANRPLCGARRGAGWFRLWLDQSTLASSPSLHCFAGQMRLFYDPVQDDYRNAAGVETRVPFFGSTRGFRYTDPDPRHPQPYMTTLVEQLSQIGYEDGVNLFGAPYDFRYGLAAQGHPSRVGSRFLDDLKHLVEEASKRNGNKPAILVTHSLGGLFALQLLNRNPSWSQQFVKHLIALAAPWGGTVIEMRIFASGNTYGFSYIDDPLVLRPETRSLESNLWLLPSPASFGDKPLVVSRRGNYSASNISEFLQGIGFEEGVGPYETRIRPLVEQLAAPGVPVTCMIGFGLATHERLIYDGENGFDDQPEVVYGDGDGTVNLGSLLALERELANVPGQVVKVVKLANMSHSGILSDELGLRQIMREISDVNSFPSRSEA